MEALQTLGHACTTAKSRKKPANAAPCIPEPPEIRKYTVFGGAYFALMLFALMIWKVYRISGHFQKCTGISVNNGGPGRNKVSTKTVIRIPNIQALNAHIMVLWTLTKDRSGELRSPRKAPAGTPTMWNNRMKWAEVDAGTAEIILLRYKILAGPLIWSLTLFFTCLGGVWSMGPY